MFSRLKKKKLSYKVNASQMHKWITIKHLTIVVDEVFRVILINFFLLNSINSETYIAKAIYALCSTWNHLSLDKQTNEWIVKRKWTKMPRQPPIVSNKQINYYIFVFFFFCQKELKKFFAVQMKLIKSTEA